MHVVVEGPSDEGVARRVVSHSGHQAAQVHVAHGRTRLDPKLGKYSLAARREPWVVFRDSDSQCPVSLRKRLLAGIPENPLFLLRIVHSMTEAWLLADVDGFASYFRVKKLQVPNDPETVQNAKQLLLRLCLGSRSRDIREEVVREDGSAGPLYTDHLEEFALLHWDLEAAITRSGSLRRAVQALAALPPRR